MGDIVAVLLQDELTGDFERLKTTLGLPPDARLPDDDIESHRSLPSDSTALSDLAVRNLAAWYGADRELYGAARAARDEINRRA
jgi:hypothetical protein